MPAIKELFGEYIRMREHGLDVQGALQTLRQYIVPLAQHQREDLARLLRAWESNLIKSVEDIPPSRDETKKQPEIWLECEFCGRPNPAKDVFCYFCGRMLEEPKPDTRTFAPATDDLYQDEYFGADSVLILKTRDGQHEFTIRPQLKYSDTSIGRSSKDQMVRPDIDLVDANAADLGVSRLHLSLAYDSHLEVIYLSDLGSANGTAVNSQKLLPSERRILRHGDDLSLGRLRLLVTFQHPGKEIT